MDVVCVALQPGGVEEDVLTALLHRTLGRRRRVTLKETLQGPKKKHSIFTKKKCRENMSEKLFFFKEVKLLDEGLFLKFNSKNTTSVTLQQRAFLLFYNEVIFHKQVLYIQRY